MGCQNRHDLRDDMTARVHTVCYKQSPVLLCASVSLVVILDDLLGFFQSWK